VWLVGNDSGRLKAAGRGPAEVAYDEALLAVAEALTRIDYGSILITIHQGEVVGIETSTKVRIKRPD
jgi:hypothetical protein